MPRTQQSNRPDRHAWQQLMGMTQMAPEVHKESGFAALLRRVRGQPSPPAADSATVQRVVGRAHGAWASIATDDAAETAQRLFSRSVKLADGD